MSGKFNPAFYVSFSADGEKFLDLAAKMLWFRHEYPGYRIVSDGMDVFTHSALGEDGSSVPSTILLGHVAVLNTEGVRIISVPCSVSVDYSGGECALDFYETGADLALDCMGINVYNITSDQWREYWEIKNGWVNEHSGSEAQGGGFVKRLFGGETEVKRASPPVYAPPPPFSPPAPPADDSGGEPSSYTEEHGSGEIGADDALRLFRDVLVYHPNEVPSYRPGTPVDEDMLRKLFDRFCLYLAGAQWEIASDMERGAIVTKMRSLLSQSR